MALEACGEGNPAQAFFRTVGSAANIGRFPRPICRSALDRCPVSGTHGALQGVSRAMDLGGALKSIVKAAIIANLSTPVALLPTASLKIYHPSRRGRRVYHRVYKLNWQNWTFACQYFNNLPNNSQN